MEPAAPGRASAFSRPPSKAVSTTVYPLSFPEYLRFRDFKGAPTSTRGQADIRTLFDDYLKWGGYPALPGTPEYSRALENMVYLELRRCWPRVRYSLTRGKRQEVDFLVSDDRGAPVLAVQVSMEISHEDTLQRELEPLVATARHFGTRENLIITMGQERKFERDGVTIHALPAWKWLLAGKSA